jgi:hypothetical protein
MRQGQDETISLFECFAMVTALAFQLGALFALLRQPLA